jgi:hypothetical protein
VATQMPADPLPQTHFDTMYKLTFYRYVPAFQVRLSWWGFDARRLL